LSFYAQQVQKLTKQLYSKDHLTRQIIQAKHFIDIHYAEPIDLDLVASKAYLSKFHFLRLFKLFYGRTPNQYLIGVRINKAKQLLQMGMPINDTCFAVGFTSITSFTDLFKKLTGQTPGHYKRKAILKKNILNQKTNFDS